MEIENDKSRGCQARGSCRFPDMQGAENNWGTITR
jgi:hypothetical protein